MTPRQFRQHFQWWELLAETAAQGLKERGLHRDALRYELAARDFRDRRGALIRADEWSRKWARS